MGVYTASVVDLFVYSVTILKKTYNLISKIARMKQRHWSRTIHIVF